MAPTKHALDRSTMFTNLLDLSAKFGQTESRAGERIVTEALSAWHDSTDVDMHAFTKKWIKEQRKDLLPLKN